MPSQVDSRSPPDQAPPGPAASAEGCWPAKVLELPSGTTARFGILVLTVALAGVWIGNSLYLTAGGWRHPAWWTLGTAAALLLTTLALAVLLPSWRERRRGWTPLAPDRLVAAQRRLAELSAEVGLGRAPVIVWRIRDALRAPVTYGIPGHYRIAAPSGLLAAVRRQPAEYDATMRHELAHVVSRDVLLGYLVLASWYAFIPLLVVRVGVALARRDLSAFPADAWRLGVLAAVVWLGRAAVLRTREHYADVRSVAADPWAVECLACVLEQRSPTTGAAASPAHRWGAWLAMHPSPRERAAVLRDPTRLGRLSFVEFLAVGLLGGAGVPLVLLAFEALPLSDTLQNDRTARMMLLGIVGAYVSASMVRAAGTGRCSPQAAGASAAGLLVGLTAGAAMSLGATPLPAYRSFEVLAGLVTAVVATGALLWTAAVARLAVRRLAPTKAGWLGVVLGAMTFALAAAATTAPALIASTGGGPSLRGYLELVVRDTWVERLAGVLVVVGLVAVGLEVRFRRGWIAAAVGVVLPALVGAAALVALRMATRGEVGPWVDASADARRLIILAGVSSAALVAAWSPRAGALLGVVAAIVAGAAVAAVHMVLSADVLAGMDVLHYPGDFTIAALSWSALVALPVAGACSLTASCRESASTIGEPRRQVGGPLPIACAVAVLVTLLVGSAVVVDAARPAPPPAAGTIEAYLVHDLPTLVALREEAVATWSALAPLDVLRDVTLPAYRHALDAARATAPPQGAEVLHARLLELIAAEMGVVQVGIEAQEQPGPLQQQRLEDALVDADRARQEFQTAWDQTESVATSG